MCTVHASFVFAAGGMPTPAELARTGLQTFNSGVLTIPANADAKKARGLPALNWSRQQLSH